MFYFINRLSIESSHKFLSISIKTWSFFHPKSAARARLKSHSAFGSWKHFFFPLNKHFSLIKPPRPLSWISLRLKLRENAINLMPHISSFSVFLKTCRCQQLVGACSCQCGFRARKFLFSQKKVENRDRVEIVQSSLVRIVNRALTDYVNKWQLHEHSFKNARKKVYFRWALSESFGARNLAGNDCLHFHSEW